LKSLALVGRFSTVPQSISWELHFRSCDVRASPVFRGGPFFWKIRGSPPRQKGVDTLLVRDLVVLAEQRAISDVVLIAGDEDIREGVSYVQERGIRVHLVIVDGAGSPRTLRQEADSVCSLDQDFVEKFASRKEPLGKPNAAWAAGTD
jgi:uncharacterized LabA/DUF88 family protein